MGIVTSVTPGESHIGSGAFAGDNADLAERPHAVTPSPRPVGSASECVGRLLRQGFAGSKLYSPRSLLTRVGAEPLPEVDSQWFAR